MESLVMFGLTVAITALIGVSAWGVNKWVGRTEKGMEKIELKLDESVTAIHEKIDENAAETRKDLNGFGKRLSDVEMAQKVNEAICKMRHPGGGSATVMPSDRENGGN